MYMENYIYLLYHQRGQKAPEIYYVTTNYDDVIIELYRYRKMGDSYISLFRMEMDKSYRVDDSQYAMSSVQLTNGSKMNISKNLKLEEEYNRICRDRKIDGVLNT